VSTCKLCIYSIMKYINYSLIFCLWLNKAHVYDHLCFSIIHVPPPVPHPYPGQFRVQYKTSNTHCSFNHNYLQQMCFCRSFLESVHFNMTYNRKYVTDLLMVGINLNTEITKTIGCLYRVFFVQDCLFKV
jgi:hypothetical protein